MSQKTSDKILPVFDHKSTIPRDRLFGIYATSVNHYVSKEHGILGTAAMIKPDSTTWAWGTETILDNHLPQDWFYDDGQISKWFKVQSDLMFILHHSFKDHDAVVLDAYDFVTMQTEYKALLDTMSTPFDKQAHWDDNLGKFKWLPFGSMCLHAIGDRYQLQGVTDCISKVSEFDVVRNNFSARSVLSWKEQVEQKWKLVKSIVEKYDPDYLAAMQVLLVIGRSEDEDWRRWATQYSLRKGTTSFTVTELLDSVLQQHQHLQASKRTDTTLQGAQANAGVTKVCAESGCSNHVRMPHHSTCPSCFKKRRSKGEPVPKQVADDLKAKQMKKARKNYARKQKKKAAQAAAAAAANNASASVADAQALQSPASASSGVVLQSPSLVEPSAVQDDVQLPTKPKKKKRFLIGPRLPLAYTKVKSAIKKRPLKKASRGKSDPAAVLASPVKLKVKSVISSGKKQGAASLRKKSLKGAPSSDDMAATSKGKTKAAASMGKKKDKGKISAAAVDVLSWNPDTNGSFLTSFPSFEGSGNLASAFGFGNMCL